MLNDVIVSILFCNTSNWAAEEESDRAEQQLIAPPPPPPSFIAAKRKWHHTLLRFILSCGQKVMGGKLYLFCRCRLLSFRNHLRSILYPSPAKIVGQMSPLAPRTPPRKMLWIPEVALVFIIYKFTTDSVIKGVQLEGGSLSSPMFSY